MSATGTHPTPSRPLGHLALLGVLIALAGFSACGAGELDGSASAVQSRSGAPSAARVLDALGYAEASESSNGSPLALATPSAQRAERKLIQTAELYLEVDSYEEARRAIDAELAVLGGFVSTADIQHRGGRVSRATLVLRVPSASLAAALGSYSMLGTLVHESLSTQDITDEYFDLEARLSSSRKLEQRLLSLLASEAEELKDLLDVERELDRVHERVERLEGQHRRWQDQVAMSTLTVQLTTRETYVAGKTQGFGEEVGQVLARSWGTVVQVGRGLALGLFALLPWLPPILLCVWLGLRSVRWLSRRLTAPRTAAMEPPA